MAKSTGIARQIDNLGRIVLPMELRRALGINVRDPLDISVEGDRIIIRRHYASCVFCGTTQNVGLFKEKPVCRDCFDKLRRGDEFSSVAGKP